ncbi:MAG: DUF2330 domain-containing protein, partial [Polyangiales bacterium]
MKKLLVAAMLSGAAFCAPRAAHAFCGFYVAPQDGPLYNDATMVALMRDGTRTVMSMSNNYKGPATDFAMVVPVPVVLQKENVKVLPHDVFKHLEGLSAPRLVEYWEQDPCHPYGVETATKSKMPMPMAGAAAPAKKADADYGVKIEAKFAVGEYEVVVLSAKQSDGLEQWLHDNKYNVPKGASSALAPYIKEQQKFFVAKVDIKKVQMDKQGVAVLSPLRFNYESQDFRLPVRLGLLNAPAGHTKQDLIVWTLSKTSRYDVANYANVFIPTNLDVTDDTKKQFGTFYAALFDEAINKAGGRAVVTEYAWTSAGCDPCPTPPLDQSEIAVLGGDVLFGMGTPPPTPTPMPMPGGPMGGPMKKPMPPTWGGGWQPVVITRLHTRYDASTLTEDLVFRAAAAVVGGREFVTGADGQIEKGAQLSSSNNFQARYIIRHKWTGPVACQNPQRGIWGGPPGQGYGYKPPPTPALNLAAAPRGSVKLPPFLKNGMPAFEVSPASTVLPAITPIAPPDVDAGAAPSASTPAPEADASIPPPASSAAPVPSVEPKPG